MYFQSTTAARGFATTLSSLRKLQNELLWLQNELLWYAERTRREATGGVGLSCIYLCRAAARNFTASQKDPRQYRTNLTSISHRGSPSVASSLCHHCYGLNPCYHGLIGCALLHIWLSITLMGCSNIFMGYPPPHPSTSSWLRCASPVLCRGINGLCRSVAVTCCAPLIKFIDHCYDAPYIIYNKNLFPPATQVTCRGIKGQTVPRHRC